jgi:hypothetical protein
MSLNLPKEVLQKIKILLSAYLWVSCEKVSAGKCKANWVLVCRPTKLGGLGILNVDKFAIALRLRWLWHEWMDETKPWIGLGHYSFHLGAYGLEDLGAPPKCKFFAWFYKIEFGRTG